MNELQEQIIACLFNDNSGWLIHDLSYALEKPAREIHHAVMELVEQQYVIEKPEKKHYPWPKVYRRLVGMAEDQLSERNQNLFNDIRCFDEDYAWGFECWFYEEIFPDLQTHQDPEKNIPIIKKHIEDWLQWYRENRLTQPDAPFQEDPIRRRPKLTI